MPDLFGVTKCQWCGAAIVWRYTAAGAKMPLDVVEERYVIDASWYLIIDDVECRPCEPMFDAPESVYHRAHSATCTNVDEVRANRPRVGTAYRLASNHHNSGRKTATAALNVRGSRCSSVQQWLRTFVVQPWVVGGPGAICST